MNNKYIDIGLHIRQQRLKKHMSQDDLSLKASIDRGQLSRIESNSIDARVSTVLKIAEALGVSVQTLFRYRVLVDTHPFVKWAGGKGQILDKIKELMPKEYNCYYEPFVGGGAVFFNVNPTRAYINDTNEELIYAYKCFSNSMLYKELIKKLEEHEKLHSEEYFYKVREMDRLPSFQSESTITDKAARMIYLNKTCVNGLYRVNSKGYFNVPWNQGNKVNTFDRKNFKEIRTLFKQSNIRATSTDFEQAVKTAKKGDFVYFDPPYDTWEDKESFTSYDKNGFGKEEQKRLAECYKRLDK